MFGKPPAPELPPEPERVLSGVEEVYAHRYVRLLALGLDPDQAVRLIDIPDVATEAERLHERGCPSHLIVDILSR